MLGPWRMVASLSLMVIMVLSATLVLPSRPEAPANAETPQQVCSGGPAAGFQSLSENMTNVNSQLSAVASGVTVREITSAGSGYSASFVYYDTPVYSPATGKMVYYVFQGSSPDLIVMANDDGSDPEVIGQSYTNPIITSDGRLVVFANPTTSLHAADIYAIDLTEQGPCKTYRLTQYNFPQGPIPGGGDYATVYFYSEYDPAASQDMIYVWQYNTIYRVFENGTLLPPDTIPDPYGSPWATFHHLKPNPKFPNVIAYLWDQLNGTIGTPETYVANLDDPDAPYLAFNSTNQGHENWAPNGEQLGDEDWPYWIAASVVGPNGSITPSSQQANYTYPLSSPLYSEFNIQKIGPNIVTANSSASLEYAPQYCAWAPDSNLLACSSISGNRTGSQYGNKPIYLLYLNGTAKFLASTDSQLKSYWGEPALVFLNDTNHIVYRSDRDGSPQLYEITLGAGFVGSVASSTSTSAAQSSSTGSPSTTVGTRPVAGPETNVSTSSTTGPATTSSSTLTSASGVHTAGPDYAVYGATLVAVVAVAVGILAVRRLTRDGARVPAS